MSSSGKTGCRETGTGGVASWDGDAGSSGKTGGGRLGMGGVTLQGRNMGGGSETGHGGLGMGGVSNIGKDGNKDLRRMNRGIRFSTGAEMAGAGGKQDRDLAGRGEDAGESRGEGRCKTGCGLAGEGVMAVSISCSIGVGIARGKDGIRGATGSVAGVKERVSGMSSRAGKGGGISSEADGAQTSWSGSGDGRGDE
jgi:hypothetical protein